MADESSQKDLDRAEAEGLRGESDPLFTGTPEEDAAREKGRAQREAMEEAGGEDDEEE